MSACSTDGASGVADTELDLLAPEHYSDLQFGWKAEAVYIGSGWCARRYTGPGRNGPWTRAGSDIQGPFKMLSPLSEDWI